MTKAESYQVEKRQTRYTYTDGPMYYLGQQIVKFMQDAGYPAKILYCYRSPEKQAELYAKGRTAPGRKVTNAQPWQSAHQFYEAVDIIHPKLAWAVSETYWDTLASCVEVVSDRFAVKLNHGHTWRFRDSAHIEMPDWRIIQGIHRREWEKGKPMRPPNEFELFQRFKEVLPKVIKEWLKRPGNSAPLNPELMLTGRARGQEK